MKKTLIYITVILLFVTQDIAISQISPNHYLINFTDKHNSKYSVDKPEQFLSQRAIERRKKFNIKITEEDLPVNKSYLDSLRTLGLKIVQVSKWTNSVSVFTTDSLLIDTINKLSFVSHIGIKQTPHKKIHKKIAKTIDTLIQDSMFVDILPFEEFQKIPKFAHYKNKYGKSLRQVQINNCHLLHDEGYTGKDVHIAILDAGFYKVDSLPAFKDVRENNQILGVRDFVDSDSMVFDASSHGMQVFSTMAGHLKKQLYGTAPDAKYWLLRSEQANSEYIIEEHNWVVAAEFADSAGVDLINSSLGYNDFDDTLTSHNYKELDGNTTLISRAADIASSKGILVVVSAGNEGFDRWKYITAPADADSALTVGAITTTGKKVYFSSVGPSSDNRIKPDVCAIGSLSVVSGRNGKVSTASGTSFSSPIMAGMLACLIQAHPTLSNMELIEIVKQSSSNYKNPDNRTGYGIPNMYVAHLLAKKREKNK